LQGSKGMMTIFLIFFTVYEKINISERRREARERSYR
jgi:hypothetical protein